MSQRSELFAPRFLDESGGLLTNEAQSEMAADLGADSLRYLPVEALARSVGLPHERLCQACVTGDYPTRAGQELYRLDVDGESFRNRAGCTPANGSSLVSVSSGKRAYE
jgi:amidophosphoribosyltransferase